MKQFEQWYYSASDKGQACRICEFQKPCPQYDTLLLQNPFIDFRFHEWYGTLGYDTLSSLDFREADVEDAYNVLCAQAPISEACRQEFVPGMLYSKTGGKGQVTEDIRQLGDFPGKQPRQQKLKLYLPVRERQKLNKRARGCIFIETLNI